MDFVICNSAYPAPCYGTRMLAEDKWDAGAGVHIIQNRKLKSPYGKVSSRQYFYQVSWGIFDWIRLDGKMGIGDVTYRAPDNTGKTIYPANFAGGYGFRALVYKNAKQGINGVCGFQHISVHPNSKKLNGITNSVILDDWQSSALISKDFRFTTPYLGARLSRLDLIHRLKNDGRKRKKSDVALSAVVGIDIDVTKSSYINAEVRFIEETSFNIGLTHNF